MKGKAEAVLPWVKGVAPGFLICVGITVLAKIIAIWVPSLGAATIAIFLGIILGNTVLNRRAFDQGTKFSESRLLEISIVLLGATLNIKDVLAVGVGGVIFIILQMTLTILVAYNLGRALGFTKKFRLLMCAGNAVCGSSAIGSVCPIVKAGDKDKGLSITMINITGTFLMILLPLLTGAIFGQETIRTSAMIGGTLQSVGQVVASASFVNEQVVAMSTVFKLIRIIFLVAVALFFSKINVNNGEPLFGGRKAPAASAESAIAEGGNRGAAAAAEGYTFAADAAAAPALGYVGAGGAAAAVNPVNAAIPDRKPKTKVGIPWFIIGFFLFCLLFTMGLVPSLVSEGAHFVSGQFEVIALAAIGMRVKFKTLISEGPKAMLYGCLIGVCQVAIALALIALLIR